MAGRVVRTVALNKFRGFLNVVAKRVVDHLI